MSYDAIIKYLRNVIADGNRLTNSEATSLLEAYDNLAAFVKFLQESTQQQFLDELKDENARLKTRIKELEQCQ